MRLKTLALAVVAALISSAALTVPARAQIEVDVNRGDMHPLSFTQHDGFLPTEASLGSGRPCRQSTLSFFGRKYQYFSGPLIRDHDKVRQTETRTGRES